MKLDLRWGYNNIWIKEEDWFKAAFIADGKLWEPTIMFFRLQNSPATFQSMMNALFDNLIKEGWVIIYMDDILIFSKDLEEHCILVKKVLQRLEEEDLFLKPEKCFEKLSIEYLSMIISQDKIQMDPAKLSAVLNWLTLKCVKDVQSFLRFRNFYRQFIQGFAHITAPLTSLTQKDTTWRWMMINRRHSIPSNNSSLQHQFTIPY